jgi:pimeloyl-ACP methyl ester carboxylesterase
MNEFVLLFCHGIGHCEDVWQPVMRRIQAQVAPLAIECASFNFPFHGDQSDAAAEPVSTSDDPENPRLHHPVATSELLVATVMAQVNRLLAKIPTRVVVGVGHSMGAIALWLAEIAHPGTFARLVLFEPVYNFTGPVREAATSFLVSATLRRRSTWPSRDAALAFFQSTRAYSRWDPESLKAFVYGSGLVENKADGRVSLALTPRMEAAFHCCNSVVYTPEELGAPRCRVRVHGAEHSKVFLRESFEELARQWPEIYAVGPVIPQASHMVNVEEPSAVAARIVEEIEALSAEKERRTMAVRPRL